MAISRHVTGVLTDDLGNTIHILNGWLSIDSEIVSYDAWDRPERVKYAFHIALEPKDLGGWLGETTWVELSPGHTMDEVFDSSPS